MNTSRLEAFSDGVIAIIITIMVLEMKIPHESDMSALIPLVPVFTSYVLSFVFIGIYWANHHHLLHATGNVSSTILWANLGLLFFLSLIPFTTGWMGENHFDKAPVALYAVNLLLCGVAFYLLQKSIVADLSHNAKLVHALKKQEKKGIISLIAYSISVVSAFYYPALSALIFVMVAIMWIVPEKNIERALSEYD